MPFEDLPAICPFQSYYSVQRLNPKELQEGFQDAFETELGLIRKVLENSDETQRAAALATLRNLNKYLIGRQQDTSN